MPANVEVAAVAELAEAVQAVEAFEAVEAVQASDVKKAPPGRAGGAFFLTTTGLHQRTEVRPRCVRRLALD